MNTTSPRIDPSHAVPNAVAGAAMAALLALAPGWAVAREPSRKAAETVATTVALADLDLSTSEGARIARERLTSAAARLCRTFGDTRKVSDAATIADCTRDTLEEALRRLSLQQVAVSREPDRR